MVRLPKRSEVPVEQTWNLDDIFPTKEAWESELKEVASQVGSVTKFKGKLGEGARAFLACCAALEELMKRPKGSLLHVVPSGNRRHQSRIPGNGCAGNVGCHRYSG
jgi:oligoendopeptidase F